MDQTGTTQSSGAVLSSFRGKSVLITGHTGFKGAWLGFWLNRLGATVHGLSLDPPTEVNLFEIVGKSFETDSRIDIRDPREVADLVKRVQPQFLFHLAAQPIVKESYRTPLETMSTNVMGTAHLLEAVRRLDAACHVIVVTSDKCYANKEWEFAYREEDPLGGHDVYSASKAAAEIVVGAWERSFFSQKLDQNVASARGGNVIGGGDFAADRILPDAMKAFAGGRALEVRSPGSIRPWQHVLDCLSGYLELAAWLATEEGSNSDLRCFNFGPVSSLQYSVGDLLEEIKKHWHGEVLLQTEDARVHHEAGRLAVSIDRAACVLGWMPSFTFQEAVDFTVQWYREYFGRGDHEGIRSLMASQVEFIEKRMNVRKAK